MNLVHNVSFMGHLKQQIPKRGGPISSMGSDADLEEVDPITGEVIEGSNQASKASGRVTTKNGFSWAYRKASGEKGKIPVVCLHAIGSSSYSYRNTIRLLGNDGHDAIALDWPGCGASDKPSPSSFSYSAEAYIQALSDVIDELGLDKIVLIVQGYVLGQYGLLWAAKNPEKVEKLIILNTPLSLSSKLRPDLAAYKAPLAFLRPKPDAKFDAANFNAGGSPYVMAYRDAMAYQKAYDEDPSAAAAVHATMEQLDWNNLLSQVDDAFISWKNPSLLIHGTADQFLDLRGALEWLETKRTTMKMASGIEAKLGHMPQEDYAEAIHPAIIRFIDSE